MDIILYNIIAAICCLFLGYIFGSIPTSIVIGKVFFHQDPRDYGSKNAGGTNSGRLWGKKVGFIVIVLDMIKTIAPIWICWAILTFVPFGSKPLIATITNFYNGSNKELKPIPDAGIILPVSLSFLTISISASKVALLIRFTWMEPL